MFTEEITTITRNSIRDKSLKLYDLMVKNKYLDYRSFLKVVEESFNSKNIAVDIKLYIKNMRHSISTTKAREMVTMIKYMIAKNNHDIDTMRELKEEVEKIGKTKVEKSNNYSIGISDQYFKKQNNKHISSVEKIKKDVDTIINNDNKSIKELYEEGKMLSNPHNLISNIKKNINAIGIDKYIEYLKANNNLQTISEEELEQFQYTIDFFIKNLERNIGLFHIYNINKDSKKISDLSIKGDEKLDPTYQNNIKKLQSWKLMKMDALVTKYTELSNSLRDFSKNNINSNMLDRNALTTIKKDEEFVYEFYNNIINIINVYNRQIKCVYSINDEEKNKLCEQYIKTLLPKRNNK